ncbi:transcriptional regulator, MarR family [Lentilactobacillus parafarraginis DSM 18390 = JCM 14109]|uniref:Transcriptional regulator, MarR family n=2 Tax=Lentilactobacillus parafarraginis TaxID=390842 RepID=A0A0R1YR51_9LACO|nr:transcriptional regulator, MarR family [Lentilactobacillus parafarraginis DSM 18390 = JCM 14109]
MDKFMTLDAQTIKQIRDFNRFYTKILHLTDRYHLETQFTLLESRILIEIDQGMTSANQLGQFLNLDKGYMSRILRRLKDDDILVEKPHDQDKRIKVLNLTAKGAEILAEINQRADNQIQTIFKRIPPKDVDQVVANMAAIQATIRRYQSVRD